MPVLGNFVRNNRVNNKWDPALSGSLAVGGASMNPGFTMPREPGGIGSGIGVGNRAGGIEGITQLVNEINQAAQQSANSGRIQNATGLQQQSSTNIGQALSGQLPQDVVNQIGQAAAERGVSSGSPMGASSNASYLKDLGLNSLQMQGQGENWLTGALARNPAAPIYDAGNQVLTAQQVQDAILRREAMANALRIAQLEGSRGGKSINIGGVPSQTGPSSSSTNWGDVFFPDEETKSQGSPPTGTSTSYPVAPAGQANSLWNMGGSYFGNTLSNYGTPSTTPSSLESEDWNNFDDWFYGGSSQSPGPTSLTDPAWDEMFASYGG